MIVIIMAGGLGKRMGSDLPKVLHPVVHLSEPHKLKPMLIRVINTAKELNPEKIFIIVGKFKDQIVNSVNNFIDQNTIKLIEYVEQTEALGTGHAVKCVLPYLTESNVKCIILSGDVPIISTETLKKLIGFENDLTNRLLVTNLEDPTGCGRIILQDGKIIKIVEQKDCTEEEKQIKLVNCGIYQINSRDLHNLLPKITSNNKSNEYYLTDIVDLMITNNIGIEYYELPSHKHYEIKNVNTQKDLLDLNNFILDMR